MTEHHVIKRGDSLTLKWQANADLTGATLRLLVSTQPGGVLALDKTPHLETVTNGVSIVSVNLDADDTDMVGRFFVELEATTADAGPVTFPSDGYDELRILQDLA